MSKKIITALNNPYVNQFLQNNCEEITVGFRDLQYQEAVLEMVETVQNDILILSELLPGELSREDFIEKIRLINEDIKIIYILKEEDKNFTKFLNFNNVFDIFINDELTIDQIIEIIKKEPNSNTTQNNIKTKALERKIEELENKLVDKVKKEARVITKIEKQEIIAITGATSVGKTDLAVQLSVLFSKLASSKMLILDLDTLQASIDQYFDIEEAPEEMDFLISEEKRTCMHYIIDAINRKTLNINNFKKYVINDKQNKNLDILTGNNSIYECNENIQTKHYQEILKLAQNEYQYIFIDTSSNIFLDSTRFAVENATKIFFIIEGTYLNIKRSLEILNMYTNIWGINQNKIKIIVNKYTKESLEKEIIEELMGGYEIITYIPYDSRHTLYLNKRIPMMRNSLNKEKEPYLKIIQQFDYIKKSKLRKKIFEKLQETIGG